MYLYCIIDDIIAMQEDTLQCISVLTQKLEESDASIMSLIRKADEAGLESHVHGKKRMRLGICISSFLAPSILIFL